jgi:AraC family transcriptional regulator, arabinose operon regulatory protein
MRKTQQYLREIHQLGPETQERLVGIETGKAFEEQHLLLVGLTEARRGYTFVRTNPTGSVLLATRAGCGEVWEDGRWRRAEPGTVYLAPSGSMHGHRLGSSERWDVAWIIWRPSAPTLRVLAPTLCPGDSEPLAAAILGLCAEMSGAAEAAMIRPWAELVAQCGARLAGTNLTDRLQPLWRAVNADLARAWTTPELAQFLGIGDERLRVLCQERLGLSPLEQVRRLRMERAEVLLQATERTVAEIAEAVGYRSPFAFSTAFKRIQGTSPLAYRRTMSGLSLASRP